MKASGSIRQMAFNHEVNEIGWSKDGKEFYVTTGQGSIEVFSFPNLQPVKTLRAHTAGCYCISFDPTGKCFAAGSADALVSIWDVKDKVCLLTLPRLDWPVRAFPLDEPFPLDDRNVPTVLRVPCSLLNISIVHLARRISTVSEKSVRAHPSRKVASRAVREMAHRAGTVAWSRVHPACSQPSPSICAPSGTYVPAPSPLPCRYRPSGWSSGAFAATRSSPACTPAPLLSPAAPYLPVNDLVVYLSYIYPRGIWLRVGGALSA
jgi:hypothetical protein